VCLTNFELYQDKWDTRCLFTNLNWKEQKWFILFYWFVGIRYTLTFSQVTDVPLWSNIS
jgi:hypothetical protein